MLVAGANLWGEWLDHKNKNEFSIISNTDHFDWDNINVCCITWSYTLIKNINDFLVVGSWLGKPNSVVNVLLPIECRYHISNVLLTGDDHRLILAESVTCKIWTLKLHEFSNWNWKKLAIDFHTTLNRNNSKRSKLSDITIQILKVIARNHSVCILTSVDVFVLPHRLETEHCKGKVIDIEYANEHGLLLTDQGKVYSWGNGMRCQLGNGELTCTDKPIEIDFFSGINIVNIKAGGWHSMAISEAGDLYTWGWNESGQLGTKKADNEQHKSTAIPELINFYDENGKVYDKNVIAVAAGSRHSVVLLDDFTVWGSGWNSYGQLGIDPDKCKNLFQFEKVFLCAKKMNVSCGIWCSVLFP